MLRAAGCEWFFVARLEEAIELRELIGAGAVVGVLNGLVAGSEAVACDLALTPVINDLDQARAWAKTARGRGMPLPCMVQFDSGMNRFGLSPAAVMTLRADEAVLEWIEPRLVMSHLACADDRASAFNAEQLAAFLAMASHFPGVPRSLAASAGMFLDPDFHFEVVRPGAAIYGLNPQPPLENPMRPVVRVQSRVLQVREVPAGSPVGYSCAGITRRQSRLATIATGYADGLFRSLVGRGAAWSGGIRLPMMGRVSMDSVVVDATDLILAPIQPGDLVDIVGPACDADGLANTAATIGYEVLTSLGHRHSRVYLPVD